MGGGGIGACASQPCLHECALAQAKPPGSPLLPRPPQTARAPPRVRPRRGCRGSWRWARPPPPCCCLRGRWPFPPPVRSGTLASPRAGGAPSACARRLPACLRRMGGQSAARVPLHLALPAAAAGAAAVCCPDPQRALPYPGHACARCRQGGGGGAPEPVRHPGHAVAGGGHRRPAPQPRPAHGALERVCSDRRHLRLLRGRGQARQRRGPPAGHAGRGRQPAQQGAAAAAMARRRHALRIRVGLHCKLERRSTCACTTRVPSSLALPHPSQVWSLVHFVMHNQPEPMSGARAQASRALAVWLLNNFWCDDCRGEGGVHVQGCCGERGCVCSRLQRGRAGPGRRAMVPPAGGAAGAGVAAGLQPQLDPSHPTRSLLRSTHLPPPPAPGFFYEGIVSVYGLPPEAPDAEAHAKWWWFAHNVASGARRAGRRQAGCVAAPAPPLASAGSSATCPQGSLPTSCPQLHRRRRYCCRARGQRSRGAPLDPPSGRP